MAQVSLEKRVVSYGTMLSTPALSDTELAAS
jgi:hypothetical protein